MDSGDELILYTDGITEADNSDGKYFGTQGIIDTINANKKAPLDQQVSEIYNSLTTFTNKKNLDDDITYVILRKK
jgi:serine phosphatase RsbU (regulator of sigma subunit)